MVEQDKYTYQQENTSSKGILGHMRKAHEELTALYPDGTLADRLQKASTTEEDKQKLRSIVGSHSHDMLDELHENARQGLARLHNKLQKGLHSTAQRGHKIIQDRTGVAYSTVAYQMPDGPQNPKAPPTNDATGFSSPNQSQQQDTLHPVEAVHKPLTPTAPIPFRKRVGEAYWRTNDAVESVIITPLRQQIRHTRNAA